jgi:hypothetical protein
MKPIPAPAPEKPVPIAIRKLDKIETTQASNPSGS